MLPARNSFVKLTVSAAVLLIFSPLAAAHGIGVFAACEDGVIKGKAYATGGGAIAGAAVRITNATTGELLGETISDDKGAFLFQPALKCDHKIIVEIDAAHRAQYIVPADELPDSLPPAPKNTAHPASEHQNEHPHQHDDHHDDDIRAMIESAVSKQIAPLRVQLDQFEKNRRLYDIIGGIGYIFGVAGVAFYLMAKKKAQGKP